MRSEALTLSIALVWTAGCDPTAGSSDAGFDVGFDVGPDTGSLDAPSLDAPSLDAPRDADLDADLDAPVDAPTCPRTLLVGGMDVAAQGWNTVMQAPATISYGADYVELATTTESRTSGQLLLAYPDAVTPGTPFALEVVMLVSAVSPHNPLDSAAAILGSFTAPAGTATERSQMIYLDAAALGWADDTQSFAAPTTDGAYHTYVLTVDAAGVATVTRDGVVALTRSGYTTTGTIALGDQTNDASVDGTVRIRSVTLLCP